MPRVLSLITVYGASIGGLLLMLYFFVPAFLQDVSILLQGLPKDYNVVSLLFGSESALHTEVAIENEQMNGN